MKKRIILFSILSVVFIALVVFLIILFSVIIPNYQKQKEREKMIYEYRENKKQQYLEENEQYDDYEVEVAFLGDSLTDGCDIVKYYPNYIAVNRGIGGDRTFDVLGRLSYSIYDLKPQVVVMLIGGNNLNTMFDDYEDILKGFKENIPDTKIILVSLTAMGGKYKDRNQMAIKNNVKIKELADKYQYYFVNVFDSLYNQDIGELYPNYTPDGLHFTEEGYQVFTGIINDKLKEVLGH